MDSIVAKSLTETVYLDDYNAFREYATELLDNRDNRERYATLYVDFNGFQMVNDIYGFEEGDRLLDAFETFLGEMPNSRVCAHVLADNFLCMLVDNKTQDITSELKDMEREMYAFMETQRRFHPNCKIIATGGFCVIQEGRMCLIEAIDNANTARKAAKLMGRVCVTWFDDQMRYGMRHMKEMAAAVQEALRNEEYGFVLQPKVNLATGKLVGAEALARWRRADGTCVMPDDFIPLMEQDRSIIELDFLIYRKAFEYLEQRVHSGLPVATISLNVSRAHLDTTNVAERVHSLAVSYGIHPSLLEFEMTETMYVNNYKEMRHTVEKMHYYGYKVSIDDFGTGYSSINMLQELSFDVLKLDKKFVLDDERHNPRSDIITSQIVEMARRLQITVLCEGVETLAQTEYMSRIGCEIAQGYYFDKPISVQEFSQKLESGAVYDLPWTNPDHATSFREMEVLTDAELRGITRALFDVLPCAVIGFDLDTEKLLFTSVNTAPLLGYCVANIDSASQLPWHAVLFGNTSVQDGYAIVRKQMLETGRCLCEFPNSNLRVAAKHLRICGDRAYSAEYGQYALCTIFDITAEIEAKENAGTLQLVLDSVQAGIARIKLSENGAQLRITFASQSLYELCGYFGEKPDLRTLCEAMRETMDDDEIVAARHKLWALVRGEISTLDFNMLRPDGSPAWYRAYSSQVGQQLDEKYWQLDCIITDVTREKRHELALLSQHDKLAVFSEQVYNNASCGILQTPVNSFTCLSVNDYAAQTFGIADPDCFRKASQSFAPFFHEEDFEELTNDLHRLTRFGDSVPYEVRVVRADGAIRWITGTAKLARAINGELVILSTFIDSTKTNETKQMFLLFNKQIATLLHAVIFRYECATDTLYFYETENSEQAMPSRIENFVKRANSGENEPFPDSKQLIDRSWDTGELVVRDFKIRRRIGRRETWLSVSFCIYKMNESDTYIGFYRDVTQEERARDELTRRARMDQLTGVANKNTFEQQCRELLATKEAYFRSALFFLDLDDFKVVNDSGGHQFGDNVLERLGAMLLRDFHKEDIVGRVGGDEFAALITSDVNIDVVEERAAKICRAVRKLFEDLSFISGSCSIGVAYGSLGQEGFDRCLKLADMALYEAKRKGKNNYVIKGMDSTSLSRG